MVEKVEPVEVEIGKLLKFKSDYKGALLAIKAKEVELMKVQGELDILRKGFLKLDAEE